MAAHPVNILKTTDLYTLKRWIVYKLYLKKKSKLLTWFTKTYVWSCLLSPCPHLPPTPSNSHSHHISLLCSWIIELATALGPGTSNLSLPGMLVLLILNSWFYFHSECSLNPTFSLRPSLITHLKQPTSHSLSYHTISIFWTAFSCLIYLFMYFLICPLL